MSISQSVKQLVPASAKRSYRTASLAFSRWTGKHSVKPTFLIIGAQKAATTTLTSALASHPAICSPLFKEVHYFDLHHHRSSAWYEAHFPKKRDCVLSFEASPYYMLHPSVPRRVHAYEPKMKLIAILRDPVERAYSHYQMEYHRKNEPIATFEGAIHAENQRVATDLRRMTDGEIGNSEAVQRYSYVHRGYYEQQLSRWLKLFPRDQLFVIDYKQFAQQPGQVLSELSGFLGIDNDFELPAKRRMQGNYSPMEESFRDELKAHLMEHNAGLEALLGMKFEWLR